VEAWANVVSWENGLAKNNHVAEMWMPMALAQEVWANVAAKNNQRAETNYSPLGAFERQSEWMRLQI
jgi:hypothetical protein